MLGHCDGQSIEIHTARHAHGQGTADTRQHKCYTHCMRENVSNCRVRLTL